MHARAADAITPLVDESEHIRAMRQRHYAAQNQVRQGMALYIGAVVTSISMAHCNVEGALKVQLLWLSSYALTGYLLSRFACKWLRYPSPTRTADPQLAEKLRLATLWPIAIPARLIETGFADAIYGPSHEAAAQQAAKGTSRPARSSLAKELMQ